YSSWSSRAGSGLDVPCRPESSICLSRWYVLRMIRLSAAMPWYLTSWKVTDVNFASSYGAEPGLAPSMRSSSSTLRGNNVV
nr:hypothetical protein [Tanacetum cinerariifolium]